MAIDFDHLRGVGQRELGVEIFAQALRIDAAAAGVIGVIEHGKADLDLGVGKPVGGFCIGGVEAVSLGQRVVRGAKAIIVGLPRSRP